jgi:glutamate N-acetyltransferase / amino-acid N-acetyltransferase
LAVGEVRSISVVDLPGWLQSSPGGVTAANGFRAGAAPAGIKEGPPRDDLAVVVADAPCIVHAVFTQCQVVAAPVIVSRERVRGGHAQGIVINSGNANACTGERGLRDARETAELAAHQAGIHPALMLVASTGVIGVPLPMERIRRGIRELSPTTDGGLDAAKAIMTTDLVPKEFAVVTELAGKTVTIGGMAKGAGMIHPNMATLLGVITTDAQLDPVLTRSALQTAADSSFNQISVDGDTSTNDTLALFASGAAGGGRIAPGSADAERFRIALETVCVQLARMVARDGEGATRLIEVRVEGARSDEQAREIAREIVRSNLVKAAIYGRDPNWGRIAAAAGNTRATIDPNAIDIFIGNVQVAKAGSTAPFDASAVSEAMAADEVSIRVVLDRGSGSGLAWGCDLTEDYVKINAEYTT